MGIGRFVLVAVASLSVPSLGAAAFAPALWVPTGGNDVAALTDVTGDGRADLVLVTRPGAAVNRVIVRPGTVSGGFGPEIETVVPFPPRLIAIDPDIAPGGLGLDLLIASNDPADGLLPLTRGAFPGTFIVGTAIATPGLVADWAVTTQLTADAAPDLLLSAVPVTPPATSGLFTLTRTDVTAPLGSATPVAGTSGADVFPVDVSGDSRPDLVMSASGGPVTVRLADGAGGFAAPFLAGVSGFPYGLGEFTGDARGDLLTISPTGLLLSPGSIGGLFGSPVPILSGANLTELGFADLNDDGLPEAVTLDGGVVVREGTSPGTFSAPVRTPIGGVGAPSSLLLDDVTGDGIADVLVTGPLGAELLVSTLPPIPTVEVMGVVHGVGHTDLSIRIAGGGLPGTLAVAYGRTLDGRTLLDPRSVVLVSIPASPSGAMVTVTARIPTTAGSRVLVAAQAETARGVGAEGFFDFSVPTPSLPVRPSTPETLIRPSIIGSAVVGGSLTANTGQWTNFASISHEWHSCPNVGVAFTGFPSADLLQAPGCSLLQAGGTLLVTPGLAGSRIRLRIIAISRTGSAREYWQTINVVEPSRISADAPAISSLRTVGRPRAGRNVVVELRLGRSLPLTIRLLRGKAVVLRSSGLRKKGLVRIRLKMPKAGRYTLLASAGFTAKRIRIVVR